MSNVNDIGLGYFFDGALLVLDSSVSKIEVGWPKKSAVKDKTSRVSSDSLIEFLKLNFVSVFGIKSVPYDGVCKYFKVVKLH